MQHATRAMPAFASERDGTLIVVIELRAAFDEFTNAVRTFANTDVDGDFVTESCARHECVADVRIERVIGGENARNSALSPTCVGFFGGAFGDDENAGMVSDIEGKSQPSDSTANNEKVS
jgi:hypothetical protein